MHPKNTNTPENEKERWYIKTPAQHVEDLVRMYAAMLMRLWRDKAKDELMKGKKGAEMEAKSVDTQVGKAASGKFDGRNALDV